jgi:hypothetical protein
MLQLIPVINDYSMLTFIVFQDTFKGAEIIVEQFDTLLMHSYLFQ